MSEVVLYRLHQGHLSSGDISIHRGGKEVERFLGATAHSTDQPQMERVAHWMYANGIRAWRYDVSMMPSDRRWLREAFLEMLRDREDFSDIGYLRRMSQEVSSESVPVSALESAG